MNKSLLKISTIFAILLILVGSAKIANDQIAKADASAGYGITCGYNTGWIYSNGTCVNTCDQDHPWDQTNQRCSGTWYGNTNQNLVVNTNCRVIYGSNYYYNGQNCAQIQTLPRANYYENPYNGGVSHPVYGEVNFNNLANNYYPNTNPNQNVVTQNNQQNYYPNISPQVPNYPNYNNSCDYRCDDYYTNYPKVKEYYTIEITTTTYYGGNPIYLSGYNNYPNQNYYANSNYASNISTYDNYENIDNSDYYPSTNSNSNNYYDGYPTWEDYQNGNYLNYTWYKNGMNGNNY